MKVDVQHYWNNKEIVDFLVVYTTYLSVVLLAYRLNLYRETPKSFVRSRKNRVSKLELSYSTSVNPAFNTTCTYCWVGTGASNSSPCNNSALYLQPVQCTEGLSYAWFRTCKSVVYA